MPSLLHILSASPTSCPVSHLSLFSSCFPSSSLSPTSHGNSWKSGVLSSSQDTCVRRGFEHNSYTKQIYLMNHSDQQGQKIAQTFRRRCESGSRERHSRQPLPPLPRTTDDFQAGGLCRSRRKEGLRGAPSSLLEASCGLNWMLPGQSWAEKASLWKILACDGEPPPFSSANPAPRVGSTPAMATLCMYTKSGSSCLHDSRLVHVPESPKNKTRNTHALSPAHQGPTVNSALEVSLEVCP